MTYQDNPTKVTNLDYRHRFSKHIVDQHLKLSSNYPHSFPYAHKYALKSSKMKPFGFASNDNEYEIVLNRNQSSDQNLN